MKTEIATATTRKKMRCIDKEYGIGCLKPIPYSFSGQEFFSQSVNCSRVMTSRSHFFFMSRACSLQA